MLLMTIERARERIKALKNKACFKSNKEELLEYEIQSAKNIAIKKQNSLEREEIIAYLAKKGYLSETIKIALEE